MPQYQLVLLLSHTLGITTSGDYSVQKTAQKSSSHLSTHWVCSWVGYCINHHWHWRLGDQDKCFTSPNTFWVMSAERQAAIADKSIGVQIQRWYLINSSQKQLNIIYILGSVWCTCKLACPTSPVHPVPSVSTIKTLENQQFTALTCGSTSIRISHVRKNTRGEILKLHTKSARFVHYHYWAICNKNSD